MTHINKVIEESLRDLQELHNHDSIPTYTSGVSDGCVTCIRNLRISTSLYNLLDAVEKDIEGRHSRPRMGSENYEIYETYSNGYNRALTDIQALIKSVKEKIQ